MTWDFSNSGRIVKLAGATLWLVALGYLSIWSLMETQRFSVLIVGLTYAIWLAIVISLGPLVCFGMASMTENRTQKMALRWVAVALNLIDTLTNVAAFWVWHHQAVNDPTLINYFLQGTPMPVWIIMMSRWFGIAICFLVSWSEEMASYVASLISQLIYEILPDPPDWLAVDSVRGALYGMSGFDAVQRQREPRQRQAKPKRAGQPVRETRTAEPKVIRYSANSELPTTTRRRR